MVRWVIVGLLLSTGAPVAAEDWWYVATEGDAPARRAGFLDADSIDRTNPAIPTVNSALYSETPDETGAVIIAKHAVDCDARTVALVHIEMRNSEGGLIAAESLEDPPFQAIQAESHYDVMRGAVCEGQWQWPDSFQFGEGKTLTQIAGEVFKE
jgi:hypothetical protein